MYMFLVEYGLLGGFVFIGEGILVVVGVVFMSKYKWEVLKEEGDMLVLIVFFGDGIVNNG